MIDKTNQVKILQSQKQIKSFYLQGTTYLENFPLYRKSLPHRSQLITVIGGKQATHEGSDLLEVVSFAIIFDNIGQSV